MPEPEPNANPSAAPGLVAREVDALQSFERLAAERAKGEVDTDRAYRARRDGEAKTFQARREQVTQTARADTTATKAKYQAAREAAAAKGAAEIAALEAEYAEHKKATAARARSAVATAKKRQEEVRWQALAVFEAGKDGAIKQFKVHEAEVGIAAAQLEDLKAAAEPTLRRVGRHVPPGSTPSPSPTPEVEAAGTPIEALQATIRTAEERLGPVAGLLGPKLVTPAVLVWPFLLVTGGLGYLLATRLGWGVGLGVGAGLGAAVAAGAYFGFRGLARSQAARAFPPLAATLAEAERLVEVARAWAKTTFEDKKDEIEQRRQREIAEADERVSQATAEAEQRRGQTTAGAEADFPPRIAAAAARRDAAIKELDEVFPRRLGEIQERFQRESAEVVAAQKQAAEATERHHDQARQAVEDHWRDGLARVDAVARTVADDDARLYLDWHRTEVEDWQAPTVVPDGLRFGTLALDLADVPNGLPVDERLRAHGPTRHALPATIPFPKLGSVLIKAADAGKAQAVSLLQTLMLRYATSVPPGKVRFTILDPVGLGENFAAFMHLGDYSELLITSRIWTETPQIDQRLVDLSAHMENVIQKYLRNEFATIEEYNTFAGEVAEPFRVLVVANFPANFSETAARRLVSIATTGARCGVYTLISIDTKLPMPAGVQLKDLESNCTTFTWREGKLHWRGAELGKLPLTFDAPPDPARFTKLMHKVGELARNANRVEVPFEFIAPPPSEYWTHDSRAGIDVPLGRAGAVKLQHLKLGKGTSQHVLIAGKTGSGKSTLLHALITNAALRYSPDEVEMYLIDFKKGVEFKVYAALELPHAKVIAVESEREFGLSVLQRLDAELKARGDKFRDMGVQDLRGYRDADKGRNPLPRILFIVDEFQEFFVEDDKIAQEVALLLDRMVRQGRAFGIHVHLGSQSLGGAYSLARSTIGQMAVRIALQCSESDAHLILSEENSAARLLTRPGEAIYNDQNGMVEGNNFFQVVFLSDERREDYLRQIRDLDRAQDRPPVARIVFEGNLPAVPSKNHLIAGLLRSDGWPSPPPKADLAWLGEAIAIKDPTAAVFRPQSGANLLIVGQDSEMALGTVQMALISLAAQHDPAGVKFLVCDGVPADSELAGRFIKVRDDVPHDVREVAMRDLAPALGDLAAEVDRRQKGEAAADAPLIYLFVFDLQRFRDLRKGEDDFGFGRYGEEKAADPPSKLFGTILREGPPLGVHTVVWCDSLNNLNRTFDRQALREFEMRVLFQMSANDSSTLIDAPSAAKLGENRALFFSEEEGRLEKFRPYGLPTEEWLGGVRDRLKARPRPVVSESEGPRSEPVEPVPAEAGDSLGV